MNRIVEFLAEENIPATRISDTYIDIDDSDYGINVTPLTQTLIYDDGLVITTDLWNIRDYLKKNLYS